jgi:hypothetical protein
MGNDVLNKYRTEENTVRDNAYAGANNFDLGRSLILMTTLTKAMQSQIALASSLVVIYVRLSVEPICLISDNLAMQSVVHKEQ